jgi:outer membrane murein-binding lipoprotein Lpp
MVQKRIILPISAAMAVSLGAWATPGSAQTLDELRAQIQEMSTRLQELEIKQEQLEKKTDETVADSQTVTSGKKGVKLTVSGQVNRGVLFADNGDDSEFFYVDNDNSSTRVRFVGVGQLTDDISVGTQIEVQFESNSTAAISFNQDSPAGPNNFTERKLELYGDSKRLGRLWVGQGDTASNGTSEVDLSGTSVVAYSGIADMAGGLEFSTDSTGAIGPQINAAFSNFDGLSRDDRLRYDTPRFGGFMASASVIDGGSWDVAGRFSGDVSGTKVAGAVAYADANSRQGFEQLNGSVSVLLPMGLNFTAAAGTRDVKGGGDDPVFYYGKLGYKFDAIDFGGTAVSIDYTMAEDIDVDGDEFTSYGAFLVQDFDKIGTEFYIGFRNHELDRPGENFDDVFAVLTGARVKF